MNYTTLRRIQECDPCEDGWWALLVHLGKKKADNKPLSLRQILDSNGLADAIWCLRAIDDCPEIRLFAVRCVREVQHLLTDPRSLHALDIAELFAVGEATEEELRTANEAAEAVAWAAANKTAEAVAWAAAKMAREIAYKEAWAAAKMARKIAYKAAWGTAKMARKIAYKAAWGTAWEAMTTKVAEAAAKDAALAAAERMESIQRRDFIDIFCQE